jgi:hypothetical protein
VVAPSSSIRVARGAFSADASVVARTRTLLSFCLGVIVLGVAAITGCGPSFQATYECEVHFEHCYAVDQGSGSVDVKKVCWREWLHNYTYGQPSDRVEYAATRFSELSLDPTLPSLDTNTRPKRTPSTAAPMPTSAFAPPPSVAESRTADRGATGASPPTPVSGIAPPAPMVAAIAPSSLGVETRAPGADCMTGCSDRWTRCRGGCKDGACDACDRTYRACAPACFQETRQAPARSLR